MYRIWSSNPEVSSTNTARYVTDVLSKFWFWSRIRSYLVKFESPLRLPWERTIPPASWFGKSISLLSLTKLSKISFVWGHRQQPHITKGQIFCLWSCFSFAPSCQEVCKSNPSRRDIGARFEISQQQGAIHLHQNFITFPLSSCWWRRWLSRPNHRLTHSSDGASLYPQGSDTIILILAQWSK